MSLGETKTERESTSPPRTFKFGGTRGDAIDWQNREEHRVVGWKTPRPEVGDLLEGWTADGLTVILRFTQVELIENSADKFFGTIEFVDYTGTALLPR